MRKYGLVFGALVLTIAVLSDTTPSLAKSCGNTAAGFGSWLAGFKKKAVAQGHSRRVVERALKGVTYDRRVVRLDRSQKSFKLSFRQFYARRVSGALIKKGRRLMKKHARTFARIEKRYGVPAEVIIAIWGLETGYGGNSGKMSVMRSLATLSFDCRRSAFFTNELMSALTIVGRGDMVPERMRGAWAGEIGQTQFLASSYVKYAVDFNGDRRRDLIRSIPDVLASTANYLRAYGWKRGKGWAPGSHNYQVLRGWNKAKVYVQTISVMATRLAQR